MQQLTRQFAFLCAAILVATAAQPKPARAVSPECAEFIALSSAEPTDVNAIGRWGGNNPGLVQQCLQEFDAYLDQKYAARKRARQKAKEARRRDKENDFFRNQPSPGVSAKRAAPPTGGDAYKLGSRAYKAKNYRLALHYWAPLARAGNVQAQMFLGYMYIQGLGGSEGTYRLGAVLLGKAAMARDREAEKQLGALFYTGGIVREDKKKGIDLLFRSVRHGSKDAKKVLIKYAQKLLAKKGYDPGPADGKIGPGTRKAITAYRQMVNLPGDPVVDKPLLLSLNAITHRAGSFTFAKASAEPANLDSSSDTDRDAGPTVEKRLERIRTLVEKGLITKEEATAKRSEILEGL